MPKRFITIGTIIFSLMVISGCQEKMMSSATTQDQPTITTPTSTPQTEVLIAVPGGPAPMIDGVISSGEWDNARVEGFLDGGELRLMHNEGFLYLGISANTQDMIVGNIFVDRGDEIAVLHSSAALGTAVYQKDGHTWQQTQGFSWCCRSTNSSDAAQAERDMFLQQESWVSINTRMGTPQELEYQIEMGGKELRLAVTFMLATGSNQKFSWPNDLNDACMGSFEGGFPLELTFSPDTWETVSIP